MRPPSSHVAILLATCNGARYLEAQIRSIIAQTWEDWSLWISDDGSTDATPAIIADLQRRYPARRIAMRAGRCMGSTRNFLSLLCDDTINADYYAFADQDDVWFPDKLARALAVIGKRAGVPQLYGARTIVTDDCLRPKGLSPLFRRPPDFRNALVQNIAGGNTMLMNRAARELACIVGEAVDPVCHDWWLYQLVSGCGGDVVYDREPVLFYRQHDGNLVGANLGARARIARLRGLMSGRYAEWNSRNIEVLQIARHLLTPAARSDLDALVRLRKQRGPRAIATLWRSGLSRQTSAGHLTLATAAAIGRL